MQKQQHQQFSTLVAAMKLWNEHASLPIRYCYVPVGSGFTAIESVSNDDKKRPWFER
jgi:hypothetical protein